MRIFSTPPRRRTGFTLVELMVAVTLIIFIMVILTEAFKAGIDAFRGLRAAGDAAERLRSAANIIRKDLASPHFESEGPDPTLREFLRDQRLDRPGWKPPERGFFRIWQAQEPGLTTVTVNELTDSDNLNFSRATSHILHFTAKYEGDEPGEYFSGQAPRPHTTVAESATTNPYMTNILNQDLAAFIQQSGSPYRYASRWAEVALFLVPNGTTATDSNGQNPITLHSLHRRVRVIPRTPTNPAPLFRIDDATALTQFDTEYDVSVANGPRRNNTFGTAPNLFYSFNNLQRLTDPRLRMDADGNGVYNAQTLNGTTLYRPRTLGELNRTIATTSEGDDILLNDVVSFEVKVWWYPHPNLTAPNPLLTIPNSKDSSMNPADTDLPFRPLPDPTIYTNAYKNPAYAARARVFDTGISDPFLQAELAALSPPLPPLSWDRAADDPPLPATPTSLGYLTNNTTFQTLNLQIPLRIHVKALQIKLRIWDVKTKSTRQVTIVQEV